MVKLVHISKVGTSGDVYIIREAHVAGGPDNTLPGGGGGGGGGHIDNDLPTQIPPMVSQGYGIVIWKAPGALKWQWAVIAPNDTTPKPVPIPIPPGGLPDLGLPPQVWPPRSPEYPTGGPVPPTATPTSTY